MAITPTWPADNNTLTAGYYISKVELANNDKYYIKDAWAREQIGAIGSPMHFHGRSLQTLTDGGREDPTKTSGTLPTTPTAVAVGDVYLQKTGNTAQEFVWTNENKWELLGDEGSYAVKGTYSVALTPTKSTVTSTTSYRPAGSVSLTTATATITVTGSYVKATGVSNGNATVTSTASYQPAGTVSKPTFTGTTATLTVEGELNLPNGTVSKPTFTGTTATITVTTSYQPAGSVSLTGRATDTVVKSITPETDTVLTGATVSNEVLSFTTDTFLKGATANTISVISALSGATFSGTTATITSTCSYQPAGTISQPTFNYSTDSFTTITITSGGSYQPAGSVSQPTFTGTTATITSTGTYSKASGVTTENATVTSTGTYTAVTGASFSGTTATITVTSTAQYMSGVTGSVTI